MRVLYAIARSVPGGAQTHVLDIIRHTSGVVQPGLVTFEPGFLTEQASEMNVPVWIVPTPVDSIDPRRDAAAVQGMMRVIREFKPDLVHAHSTKTGVIARLAAHLAGVPLIFTAHGWAFTEGVGKKRRKVAAVIERMAAPFAKRIICVSDYDRNLALRCRVGNSSKIEVIHNGIAPLNMVTDYPKRETVRCVMVARFSPQKDQLALIEAMREVRGAELMLVGDGELLEESRALASSLGVDDRVRFLGSRNDVQEILADCDIFVLASRWEGLPYTILEGMRAGLPVVASNVGGVSEAVIEGETGYLVPWEDVNAMSMKLQYLVDHPQVRRELGEAGRRLCVTKFAISSMIEAISATYHDVIGEGGRR